MIYYKQMKCSNALQIAIGNMWKRPTQEIGSMLVYFLLWTILFCYHSFSLCFMYILLFYFPWSIFSILSVFNLSPCNLRFLFLCMFCFIIIKHYLSAKSKDVKDKSGSHWSKQSRGLELLSVLMSCVDLGQALVESEKSEYHNLKIASKTYMIFLVDFLSQISTQTMGKMNTWSYMCPILSILAKVQYLQ